MKILAEKHGTDAFHSGTSFKSLSRCVIAKSGSVHFWVLMVCSILLLPSCLSTKAPEFFEKIVKDTTINNVAKKDLDPVIQKGDLLGITIGSLSPENTVLYNFPQNALAGQLGYLVDSNGQINFVKLGLIQAAGITRNNLKLNLESHLKDYLTNPVVAIGFLNRHVTVLGPSGSKVLPMPEDNMTLIDAIANTGGIGAEGKITNILVVREKDGSKEFKRLNLTDASVFHSPYFYLQPNDLVYVSPDKKKGENVTRIVGFVTAGLSLAIFIIDRVLK